MKNKITNYIISTLIFILTIYFFANSSNTINLFINISKQIIYVIIPSLFPFMIFVNFILYSNTIDYISYLFSKIFKFLNISGYGISCIIASIIGGYPYGSILLTTFVKENKITKREAEKLLYTTFFPSISFIIVSLINKNIMSLYIIISIYIASLIILLLQKKQSIPQNKLIINNNITNTYYKVMNSTITSTISIYFSILFFSLISNIFVNNIKNKYIKYLLSGIFEFSLSSISILNDINLNFLSYLILTFILSFSSLSIIFQSFYYLKEINITIKKLLSSRITISLLSCLIFTLIYFLVKTLT